MSCSRRLPHTARPLSSMLSRSLDHNSSCRAAPSSTHVHTHRANHRPTTPEPTTSRTSLAQCTHFERTSIDVMRWVRGCACSQPWRTHHACKRCVRPSRLKLGEKVCAQVALLPILAVQNKIHRCLILRVDPPPLRRGRCRVVVARHLRRKGRRAAEDVIRAADGTMSPAQGPVDRA
jgi:hypothetical protein